MFDPEFDLPQSVGMNETEICKMMFNPGLNMPDIGINFDQIEEEDSLLEIMKQKPITTSYRNTMLCSSADIMPEPVVTPQSFMLPQKPQNLMRPMAVNEFQQTIASISSGLPSHDIMPEIKNVVSTVNLCCKLDLKKIILLARNAEYNPKRYAAVIMRIREPKTTALIFSSGKMICTGARNENDSRLAARKYARIIQKLGFPAKFRDFKIKNVMGTCDVMFPIHIENLAREHRAFSSYEPELFPALIYRMVEPRVVFQIFISGKVSLLGARETPEIYAAFNKIYPILKKFKR